MLQRKGDTAVHMAVEENNVKLLKELLRRGMCVFNQSEIDGATALHR